MSVSIPVYTFIEIDIDDYVSLYGVKAQGGDEDTIDIECDSNGNVTVIIDGYIIDKEDYDRLQTLDLIENYNE